MPDFIDDEFNDVVIARTVGIIRCLDELKEDVLHARGLQPDFDGGMLEAAIVILRANIPHDDPRVVAENNRQSDARLVRALAAGRSNE